MARRVVATAVALTVLASTLDACAHDTTSRGEHPAARSSAPRAETPVLSTGAEADPVAVTEASDRPPAWRLVEDWPRDDPRQGFGLSSASVSLISSYTEAGGSIRIADRTGSSLSVEPVAAGWSVQETWLDDQYAVAEVLNLAKRKVAVHGYALRDGRIAELELGAVNDRRLGPSMAYFGSRIAWTTGDPVRRMCISIAQLPSGRSRSVACLRRGIIIGDVALDEDTLVFSALSRPRSFDQRCKQIQVVDFHGRHDHAAERTMASLSDCDAWSAVPLHNGVAWDVSDPNAGEIAFADGHALVDNQHYELGRLETDSFLECGDHLWWTNTVHEATTPFMWVPAAPTFSRALELPEDQTKSGTSLACASDRFVSTRIEDVSGHDEHVRLLTLDTHDLD